ncbi:hypothetical protein EVAR_79249_1 [Eumeta japonica]|uniref:Uncharacterized protein n=1 Tax=Eumeta variegata TaxID=151549 RepID=A0A4C1TH47_EUMVA|nr:hypothetical protein EVAR_79249_1 [Eumeta japonica]
MQCVAGVLYQSGVGARGRRGEGRRVARCLRGGSSDHAMPICRYFTARLLAQGDASSANGERCLVDHTGQGWHEAARLVYDFARLPRIGRGYFPLKNICRRRNFVPTWCPTTPLVHFVIRRQQQTGHSFPASLSKALTLPDWLSASFLNHHPRRVNHRSERTMRGDGLVTKKWFVGILPFLLWSKLHASDERMPGKYKISSVGKAVEATPGTLTDLRRHTAKPRRAKPASPALRTTYYRKR